MESQWKEEGQPAPGNTKSPDLVFEKVISQLFKVCGVKNNVTLPLFTEYNDPNWHYGWVSQAIHKYQIDDDNNIKAGENYIVKLVEFLQKFPCFDADRINLNLQIKSDVKSKKMFLYIHLDNLVFALNAVTNEERKSIFEYVSQEPEASVLQVKEEVKEELFTQTNQCVKSSQDQCVTSSQDFDNLVFALNKVTNEERKSIFEYVSQEPEASVLQVKEEEFKINEYVQSSQHIKKWFAKDQKQYQLTKQGKELFGKQNWKKPKGNQVGFEYTKKIPGLQYKKEKAGHFWNCNRPTNYYIQGPATYDIKNTLITLKRECLQYKEMQKRAGTEKKDTNVSK